MPAFYNFFSIEPLKKVSFVVLPLLRIPFNAGGVSGQCETVNLSFLTLNAVLA